ncbi:MAG: Pyruvoyl-dependent arginine decarboxylase [Acidimicrobiales bacterium]|nr:Pyruvoyl-dependent arginine decarboxylase [Acidimicrobiales bacterium]
MTASRQTRGAAGSVDLRQAVRSAEQSGRGLTITVRRGIGQGPTPLAAFDAALRAAGVADRNLLTLSSVIPASATVTVLEHGAATADPGGTWGDRLYVVLAAEHAEVPSHQAWAGIGWVQEAETGRGLFVEHHAGDADTVQRDIDQSLASLVEGRPALKFGPHRSMVAGATCTDRPACALVVAAYQASAWQDEPLIELD